MELRDVVPMVLMTAANLAGQVGIGKVEKYYPILIQIEDMRCDERTTYYLDDVRAWAKGDFDGIAGDECLIISALAQAILSYTERIEAQHEWLLPETRRIENRSNDD